jgi:hypothetical protein
MTFDDPATPDELQAAAADQDRTIQRGRYLRRRRQAVRAGTMACLAAAAVTLPLTLIKGGHPGQQVATAPTLNVTSTRATRVVPTTSVSTAVPSTSAGVGGTTIVPECTTSQLQSNATTARHTYPRGQTVVITLTYKNAGVTCTGHIPSFCGIGATAVDSADHDVWDSWAKPTGPPASSACEAEPSPAGTVLSSWSKSVSISWSQGRCVNDPAITNPGSPNPDCPNSPVPDGTYTLTIDGMQSDFPIVITG